jgi:hypothetical protein
MLPCSKSTRAPLLPGISSVSAGPRSGFQAYSADFGIRPEPPDCITCWAALDRSTYPTGSGSGVWNVTALDSFQISIARRRCRVDHRRHGHPACRRGIHRLVDVLQSSRFCPRVSRMDPGFSGRPAVCGVPNRLFANVPPCGTSSVGGWRSWQQYSASDDELLSITVAHSRRSQRYRRMAAWKPG